MVPEPLNPSRPLRTEELIEADTLKRCSVLGKHFHDHAGGELTWFDNVQVTVVVVSAKHGQGLRWIVRRATLRVLIDADKIVIVCYSQIARIRVNPTGARTARWLQRVDRARASMSELVYYGGVYVWHIHIAGTVCA